ncbi:unnamed protein product [Rhizophagus irregularis]|nr:unnamed protein product [Rhizophagus irregularis]
MLLPNGRISPLFIMSLQITQTNSNTDAITITDNVKIIIVLRLTELLSIPQSPIANEAVVHEISRQLGNWNVETGQNGIVTTSQGG